MTMHIPTPLALTMTAAIVTMAAGSVAAKEFGGWGDVTSAEALAGSHVELNTASNDGCPILSPYDGSLYMASNRPGGHGGLDIWIAPASGDGWGQPVNAGSAINTSADEFCPSPARGNRFFFIRRLSSTNTDIFVARKLPAGFGTPTPLPIGVGAINSPSEEWSPSWFETADGNEVLYFSSTRNGHPAHDIFYSVNYGPAQLAPGGVNGSSSDARPNVRRDGLEIVWDSNRAGSLGGPDIWTASRSSVDDPWGVAVHLDAPINSAGNETRASLSWDGTRLMFGTTRTGVEGSGDIFTATRDKTTGN